MRPIGWNGQEAMPDEKTAGILLILNEAGKSITYKHAGVLIDELNKKEDENVMGIKTK